MAKKKEEDTVADLRPAIQTLRNEIGAIEAFAEQIPTYYKHHVPNAKPRGHHTANERARCFRESTLLYLALGRGWLGKALGALGQPTPYPESDNPNSPTIEPPAYVKPVASDMGDDPVAAIKSVRSQIAQTLEHIDGMCEEMDEMPENGFLSFVIQAKFELQRARLTLGEELGILGGH